MLDGVSLDHLRIFVAVADTGSFSAAARKIGRTQPGVSQAIAWLEGQLGVAIFDRTGRAPKITAEGHSLLVRARNVVRGADALRAEARSLAAGLEAEVSLVIDMMYPQSDLTAAVIAFAERYPTTSLQLHVEVLGAVPQLVISGHCMIGIMGPLPVLPPEIECIRVLSVEMVTVVAPLHELSRAEGKCHPADLRHHRQLVLSDRSSLTAGQDFGVFGEAPWRLSDVRTKHAFLLAGLGWGHMPLQMVDEDIRLGRLKRIDVDMGLGKNPTLPMHAIYRRDNLPGPAGRWLIESLGQGVDGAANKMRWPEMP